jgi:hypothetical protein
MLYLAGHQQLRAAILATLEAEIRRIEVQSQLGEIVLKTLSGKSPSPGLAKWLKSGKVPA